MRSHPDHGVPYPLSVLLCDVGVGVNLEVGIRRVSPFSNRLLIFEGSGGFRPSKGICVSQRRDEWERWLETCREVREIGRTVTAMS